jgi:type II secretory pathway component PulJ
MKKPTSHTNFPKLVSAGQKHKNAMPFFSAGFTLVEALVAITFFIFLEIGVTTVIQNMYKNYNQQSAALNNADLARKVTFGFASEIRNSASGNDGAYSLNQAGDSQIIFYSNADSNGAIAKRIRYYLSGNTLYKGIVTPTGNPLTYNLSSEVVSSVETNLVNGTANIPVFSYYDSDYDGNASPLAQPVNVNQVKFVKINLAILNQIGKNSVTFTISAGAALRNLKTNLGS